MKTLTCPECGVTFVKRGRNQVYCSPECSKKSKLGKLKAAYWRKKGGEHHRRSKGRTHVKDLAAENASLLHERRRLLHERRRLRREKLARLAARDAEYAKLGVRTTVTVDKERGVVTEVRGQPCCGSRLGAFAGNIARQWIY